MDEREGKHTPVGERLEGVAYTHGCGRFITQEDGQRAGSNGQHPIRILTDTWPTGDTAPVDEIRWQFFVVYVCLMCVCT